MEIELKFILPEQQISAFKQAIINSHYQFEDRGEAQLGNAYYDTEEQVLRQWDIGLRTRTVERAGKAKQAEQTVKLAGQDVAGLQQRPEYTLPLVINQETDAIFANLELFDSDIWPQGFSAKQINANLVKVFATEFCRHTWHIRLASGALVECVLDRGHVQAEFDGELVEQVICEFELELLEGQVASLFELAHYFSSKVSAKLGYLSKAARGYQLAQGRTNRIANLANVELSSSGKLEQALIKSLSYGLNFIQLNELVFAKEHRPKAFRRILDGVSLIIQTLTLFSPYLPNSRCQEFIERFKKWRTSASWVESFYQLERLQDRKSPYRKDIENNEALTALLSSKKMPEDKLEQLSGEFSSADFNQLILSFSHWIADKGWRGQMPAKALSVLNKDLHLEAGAWLEDAWQSVKHAIKQIQLGAADKSVERAYWQLAAGMLTGIIVGNLYSEQEREQFRSQLLNLLLGFEEYILLVKLQNIVATEPGIAGQNLKWINTKMDSLQVALSASLGQVDKLKPYW